MLVECLTIPPCCYAERHFWELLLNQEESINLQKPGDWKWVCGKRGANLHCGEPQKDTNQADMFSRSRAQTTFVHYVLFFIPSTLDTNYFSLLWYFNKELCFLLDSTSSLDLNVCVWGWVSGRTNIYV